MLSRIGSALAAASLAVGAPGSGNAPEPRAAAWAVRISIVSPVGELIHIADVDAAAGGAPRASGSPLMIAGSDPNRVSATPGAPDASASLQDYDDPTGSSTMHAGFADARATEASTQARAGFTSFNASGFAMANELFTFEQQTELLAQWQGINDAIFGPLNEQLAMLDPLVNTAGLERPRIVGIAPTGLIDVIKASNVSSSADAGSSPGFASARASTTITELRLFGGFIEAHGIDADAVSESVSGDDTREARARIGSLSIAGISVIADQGGFRVAGNTALARSVLQPALDQLIKAFEQTGLTIRAVEPRATGDLREATALEVSLASPQGALLISIAHAEASASTVSAPVVDEPAPTPRVVEPLPPPPVTDPVPEAGPPPAGAPPAVTTTTPPTATGPLMRSYGLAAARAMRTTYLLVMIGALIGALAAPSFIRRRPARSEGVLR